MCAVGFLPLLNEREKVFTVEGHQGSAFGHGKSQLLDIGQSEMSSLLCSQAIHSMRRQCGAEYNRNVFIQIQLHSWRVSNLRGGECLRVEGVIGCHVGVKFLAVVIVVGQGIVNGGEREMRVITEEVLGSEPMVQDIHHDCANGDPRAFDARTAAAHIGLTHDMGMHHVRHEYESTETSRLEQERREYHEVR